MNSGYEETRCDDVDDDYDEMMTQEKEDDNNCAFRIINDFMPVVLCNHRESELN